VRSTRGPLPPGPMVCSTHAGSPRSTTQETPIGGLQRVGQPTVVRPDGAGQGALLGPSNAEKSALHGRLTGSHADAEPYPFTTQFSQPGMLCFEDIAFQLIDLSPVSTQHPVRWPAPSWYLPARHGELLGEAFDAGLDVAPEIFGALVLRDRPEHFLQRGEPVLGSAGMPVLSVGGLALGRAIRRHLRHHGRPCPARRKGDDSARTPGHRLR
jgi:50S ribosome-binding GTPase